MFRHLVKLAALFVLAVFLLPSLKQVHWSYINYFSKYVVKIENLAGTSGGTGFYLKHNGKVFIITNQHVCELAVQGLLVIGDEPHRYGAMVYKIYPNSDLCAITAPNGQTTGLKLARRVTLHERIYVIGHPLLEPMTITEGEISSYLTLTIPYKTNVKPEECKGFGWKIVPELNPTANIFGVENYCVRELTAMSMTAQILGGNSGSPVVNDFGSVVGVAFAWDQSKSYAVPFEDLYEFAESL